MCLKRHSTVCVMLLWHGSTDTVEQVGLWSDSLEPCVYGGPIVRDGYELGFCLCIVYVDDILLVSTGKEAEEYVVEALPSVVPVKTTGEIGDEGGSLTFIGRVIRREKNSSEITLGVDPHYLDSTFQDYGITNGSSYIPDISGHLERTLSDKNLQKPLSDAAYTRFRKALGKLLWLSQVRHDLGSLCPRHEVRMVPLFRAMRDCLWSFQRLG